MAWIEQLRGLRQDHGPEVPFGVQLRRARASSQNPPLAKLRHFIADNANRFITVTSKGKSVLAPDPFIPLETDTAGFRVERDGTTAWYYIFPEVFEAEIVPDGWTAHTARSHLAHNGQILSRQGYTSLKVSRLLLSPYGIVGRRLVVVVATKL